MSDDTMGVSAQVAVYPLRQVRLTPAVEAVRQALEAAELDVRVGSMSTLVVGDAAVMFTALAKAFAQAAALGPVVMTVTVSNACPVPD